jgi:2-oxoglutarate ferredoxin oxidoreductase subunit delta|uniref:4Fe-4S dicluster domain-containing protein n=1 Tax=Desulfobacca acetoxidans TaxID=60893 RepID=A0A7C5AN89_9BACT
MPENHSTHQAEAEGSPKEAEVPFQDEPAKPKKHYEIDIYRAWCKACGLCAAFCPRECLSRDEEGHPVVTHPERCTGCGWCEIHCPDFAISVRECPTPIPKEEMD